MGWRSAFRRSGPIYLVEGGIGLGLLALDVVLPHGATAAIGYCLVPVIAGGTRNGRHVVMATAWCSLLTWVGYVFEEVDGGVVPSMTVFDRSMITGVLWLTALLVWRRGQEHMELVRAKRELEEVNGELKTFAGVVAHDVRGPLNTIGLYNGLLERSEAVRGDEECVSWTKVIAGEVERMARQIGNLLRFARTGELAVVECDTGEVLAEVRQGLAAQIESVGADVNGVGLPVVWADRGLLAEVFQNLIENAMKYRGEAPPRIRVLAERAEGEWVFYVRDNGVGVGQADRGRIFEAFTQGTKRAGGVGLGLATCKRIVERHGGKIGVESVVGEGSTFWFTIPGEEKSFHHGAHGEHGGRKERGGEHERNVKARRHEGEGVGFGGGGRLRDAG